MPDLTKLPGRSEGYGRALNGALGGPSPEVPACPAPGGDGPRRPGFPPAAGPAGGTATSMEDGAARSWTVALPPGLELLSLNGREHFMARARTFKSLKTAAWAMLVNARLPKLDRITVRVIYDPPDRRDRDPDNLSATVKPLVDAIVAAKIIPDDTSVHVAWAHAEIGPEVHKPSRVRIVITEVPAGEAA